MHAQQLMPDQADKAEFKSVLTSISQSLPVVNQRFLGNAI